MAAPRQALGRARRGDDRSAADAGDQRAGPRPRASRSTSRPPPRTRSTLRAPRSISATSRSRRRSSQRRRAATGCCSSAWSPTSSRTPCDTTTPTAGSRSARQPERGAVFEIANTGPDGDRRADPEAVRALRPRRRSASTLRTASGSAFRSPARSRALTTPRSAPPAPDGGLEVSVTVPAGQS